MFYPMLAEGDSILWLGSREKGLIRFDKQTEEYKVISLKEILHKSVDDVLSLHRAKDGRMYVGTTSGLVCLTFNKKQISASYIGREQGLLNDMIHGILEDANGFLWLGTNRGLIKYNPKTLLRMLIIMPPVCRWASLVMMPIINVLIPDVFSLEVLTVCFIWIRKWRQLRNSIRTYYCVS